MAFQTRNKHLLYKKSVYKPVYRGKKDGISDTVLWHLTHEIVNRLYYLHRRTYNQLEFFVMAF